MDAAEAAGEFSFPRRGAVVRPQKHAGEWRVNVTQLRNKDGSAADGTDVRSLSQGELEGRRQVVEYLRFLREKVPGFENAYALDIAPQLGIRETRRLVGEYMLTAQDVLSCADFDDSIGVNGWPLENTSPATCNGSGLLSRGPAATTSCLIACCCRAVPLAAARSTSSSRAAAPR